MQSFMRSLACDFAGNPVLKNVVSFKDWRSFGEMFGKLNKTHNLHIYLLDTDVCANGIETGAG